MNISQRYYPVAAALALALAELACGPVGSSQPPSEAITATIAPITLGSDLTQINVCQAIPQELMEQAMGRKLVSAPQQFNYYDTVGSSGCWYDGGKDASGEAHYGYVVLTPPNVYDEQPLYLNTDVSGIGDEAYFNNGADARQLWVRFKDRVAFVIAFGDIAREGAAEAVGKLLAAAIQ